jgi:hypothetical protein
MLDQKQLNDDARSWTCHCGERLSATIDLGAHGKGTTTRDKLSGTDSTTRGTSPGGRGPDVWGILQRQLGEQQEKEKLPGIQYCDGCLKRKMNV